MKVLWVLSDNERNRRFNKFNKLKEPYMTFTIEETKFLEEIHTRFNKERDSWVFKMIKHNQVAFTNYIEAAFNLAPIEYSAWRNVENLFEIYFTKIVIPQFNEVDTLPSYDRSVMLAGDNSRVAHAFKSSLSMYGSFDDIKIAKTCHSSGRCPQANQFKDIAKNKKLMETLGLEDKLAHLDINDHAIKMPRYQTLFPANWANNKEVEERHRQIFKKILMWTTIDNKMDGDLHKLMRLILFFNPDFTPILQRDKVEKLQLKYILLLQRYLKSKMEPADANKKFLDAMLLISYTKEMLELQKLHVLN